MAQIQTIAGDDAENDGKISKTKKRNTKSGEKLQNPSGKSEQNIQQNIHFIDKTDKTDLAKLRNIPLDMENAENDLKSIKKSSKKKKNKKSSQERENIKNDENQNLSESEKVKNGGKINSKPEKIGFFSPEKKANELVRAVGWVLSQRKNAMSPQILPLLGHSSVQVRRKVAETLGLVGFESMIGEMSLYRDNETDRQTFILLTNSIDRLRRQSLGENLASGAEIFSVSEAILFIKKTLGREPIWVEGEIGEIKKYGEMLYFTLKEEQKNSLPCFCFARLLERFQTPLAQGWTIRVLVNLRLNRDARLQAEVQKIFLTGEGEVLRQLEELRQKLEAEGLFEQERKQKLCSSPERILLLASPNSAALGDFCKVLNERRKGVEIFFLPIKTQGANVEKELLTKFALVNQICHQNQIQNIVLTRGGGSAEDLQVWNLENVIRQIANFNRPTIAAIGHERDISLAEQVVHRASTPTQAAILVSLSQQEILQETQKQLWQIEQNIQQKIQQTRQFSLQIGKNMESFWQNRQQKIRIFLSQLDAFQNNIFANIRVLLLRQKQYLDSTNRKLFAYREENSRLFAQILAEIYDQYYQIKELSQKYLLLIKNQDWQQRLKEGWNLLLTENGQYILNEKTFKTCLEKQEKLFLLTNWGKVEILDFVWQKEEKEGKKE